MVLENPLLDARHDLFTRAGLGHLAARSTPSFGQRVALTVESPAALLGVTARDTTTILSRLRRHRLIITIRTGARNQPSWRAGEKTLQEELMGPADLPYKQYRTQVKAVGGYPASHRYFDGERAIFDGRQALEAKVSYQGAGTKKRKDLVIRQAVRDGQILREGTFDSIEWHFYPNSKGVVGLSAELRRILEDNGISIVVHVV